jgi:hypothetical protein
MTYFMYRNRNVTTSAGEGAADGGAVTLPRTL